MLENHLNQVEPWGFSKRNGTCGNNVRVLMFLNAENNVVTVEFLKSNTNKQSASGNYNVVLESICKCTSCAE